jgi:hypothetical protein
MMDVLARKIVDDLKAALEQRRHRGGPASIS